jgi:hypothetical protein
MIAKHVGPDFGFQPISSSHLIYEQYHGAVIEDPDPHGNGYHMHFTHIQGV